MEIILDFSNIKDKTELHIYLKRELQLPDYYGNNMDALHDCLSEHGNNLCITVVHFDVLKQALGDYADVLLQVFLDSGIDVKMK